MKLLFCPECFDVFKLEAKERSCKCGMVTGRYINISEAVTNGKGYSIAIGNGSLINAIRDMTEMFHSSEDYGRHDYIKGSRIEGAWVRPNEGIGNPHTKVIKE